MRSVCRFLALRVESWVEVQVMDCRVSGEILMARWNCHSWIQARIEGPLLRGPRMGIGGGGVRLRGGRRLGIDIVVDLC